MTGSTPFLIEPSKNFERSFKKLFKVHGDNFKELMEKVLKDLTENQYPVNSRQEPLPRKIQLPEEWTFHKLELKISKGASGQIRLMYLIDPNAQVIKLVWVYSHDQFAKRPADQDLRNIIQEFLGY